MMSTTKYFYTEPIKKNYGLRKTICTNGVQIHIIKIIYFWGELIGTNNDCCIINKDLVTVIMYSKFV